MRTTEDHNRSLIEQALADAIEHAPQDDLPPGSLYWTQPELRIDLDERGQK